MKKFIAFALTFVLLMTAAWCSYAEDEMTTHSEFDFEKKSVLLNSGYEMPVMGLGT